MVNNTKEIFVKTYRVLTDTHKAVSKYVLTTMVCIIYTRTFLKMTVLKWDYLLLLFLKNVLKGYTFNGPHVFIASVGPAEVKLWMSEIKVRFKRTM